MGMHDHPAAMEAAQREEVDVAMRTLAALFGDVYATARVLDEQSVTFVSPELLAEWRQGQHRELYEKYADELAPGLEEAIIRRQRELAARATALEDRLLGRIEKELNDRTLNNTPQALAAVTKAKQTAVDKLFTLTQRPTQITETRNAADIVRQLEALRVLVPIGPAVDVEAEVVE
jgi:hypothetical protein